MGEGYARTGKCDSELLEDDGEPDLGGDSSISCHPFDLISGSIGLGFGFGRFGIARTAGGRHCTHLIYCSYWVYLCTPF